MDPLHYRAVETGVAFVGQLFPSLSKCCRRILSAKRSSRQIEEVFESTALDPDSARVESRNFKSNRIFFFALSFSLFLLCALAFYFLLCFTSVYYSISPPASLFLLFYYLLFSLFIFTFNSFINYFLIPSLFIKMYKKCEK